MTPAVARYWTEQMEAAMQFVDRVARHPVEECGETLADIVQEAGRAGVPIVCSARPHARGLRRLPLLRRAIVPGLLAAASELARDGLTLVIEDAFRTDAMQRNLAREDQVLDGLVDIMLRAEPGFDTQLVARRLAAVVAATPKTAGHMAGAAVDVSVARADGSELDRGAPYLTVSEVMPIQSPYVSGQAAANRRRVTAVMERHGFLAYPYEFWHYSQDDAFARVAADDPTPARYGPIDMDGVGGAVTPCAAPMSALNSADHMLDLIARRLDERE